MAGTYEKYGKRWKTEFHPLEIEMWAIRNPEWVKSQGRTLAYHYEEFRKMCWPKLDSHRWHTLCLEEITKNKVTVLMGPGSSGKTHEAAWTYLVEYWCYPQETCVLVSSTDMRGLRKRVWGELTDLWQQGVDRFDFLGGNLLDSALAITTDSLEDMEFGERKTRDMRKGIFGIPCIQGGKFVGLAKFVGIKQKRMRLIADEACFPAGTKVDTPSGPKPIESILPGDVVLNCNGPSMVRHSMKKSSQKIVTIKSSDGRVIQCTPTHPFFTQKGWVCACELNQSHYMVSVYEAMQILRGEVPTYKQRQILPILQRVEIERAVQAVRVGIHKEEYGIEAKILQPILHREISANRPGISEKVLHQKPNNKNSIYERENLQGASRNIRSDGVQDECDNGKVHGIAHTTATRRSSSSPEPHYEKAWSQTKNSRRERDWSDSGRNCNHGNVSGIEIQEQPSSPNQDEERKRIPNMLQVGLSHSRTEAGNRSRWRLSHNVPSEATGRKENNIFNGTWVDSVEIQESKNFRGLETSEGGVAVYNLEIEGHPSFSVNGVLVHNSMMGESFLSAFANLNKNEDFRAIVLGNPNDPIDPLGRAAEPMESWTDDYMEPGKTRVWNTRFMSGRCVNLIGTDSPNFDFPQDQPTRYKYLISREKIAETLSFFPKDSLEYYSQCIGSMKIGTMARRVLTRKMCIDNHALDKAIWKTEPHTRVYFVDASYGGDLCVGGSGDIGEDVDGKIVLQFNEPKVIPIKVGTKDGDAEYQIAEFVKMDLERQDIPPHCMGHDSTGRGALGTALSKVLNSADTHPIESGGSASDRPVSADLYVTDEITGERRLKLCKEHYDRKVSEFWFQVRYAVESSQIRGMPEECLSDLSTRKWDRIKKDIISVEPKNRPSPDPQKQGMKQRTGKSPDHGDWAAGIVEMARRKGFVIARLAVSESQKSSKPSWLDTLYEETQSTIKSHQLQES